MALQIAETVDGIRAVIAKARSRGAGKVAVVPTMGGLHEGHLSLVKRAGKVADHVVVTIFVNPTQFNNPEDFNSYPSHMEQDLKALEGTTTDSIFAPSSEEMYPEGFATKVVVQAGTDVLCDAHRPGHFSGVATVVTKLFLQTGADIACFGEKDYQQLFIVKQLVKDLNIPIRIEPVETVRESDGLAMSSRNKRLTEDERVLAPALHKALQKIRTMILDGRNPVSAISEIRQKLEQETPMRVEYLEMRSGETLELLKERQDHARLFAAANLGLVRLIDNIAV